MIQVEDPVQFAEDLRKLGFDACHEIVYGPSGYLEGVDVGTDFFPLWELSLPENRLLVAALNFDGIKARRRSDWTVVPPSAGSRG
ncbi:MAG: hypothetical protein U0Q18_03340 [Bryobacteraceae bacterium]